MAPLRLFDSSTGLRPRQFGGLGPSFQRGTKPPLVIVNDPALLLHIRGEGFRWMRPRGGRGSGSRNETERIERDSFDLGSQGRLDKVLVVGVLGDVGHFVYGVIAVWTSPQPDIEGEWLAIAALLLLVLHEMEPANGDRKNCVGCVGGEGWGVDNGVCSNSAVTGDEGLTNGESRGRYIEGTGIAAEYRQ